MQPLLMLPNGVCCDDQRAGYLEIISFGQTVVWCTKLPDYLQWSSA